MEPMTLGSPVGSPSSPTSKFLPSFLMGDQINQTPGMHLHNKSPSRLSRNVSFGGTFTALSPQEPPRPTVNVADRATGPPTKGLFDAEEPQKFDSSANAWTSPNSSYCDRAATHWVTVFGFPPSAASSVISHFGRHGGVLETRGGGGGNWVHLRYSSSGEARRALGYNGRVLGAGVMVGVVPCRDQEVLNSANNKENSQIQESFNDSARFHDESSHFHDASSRYLNNSVYSPNMSFRSPSNAVSPRHIGSPLSQARPLGHGYRNAQHSTEVLLSHNTPQKSTSLASKAWEFLGW